jgi:hypothetical protein
VTWTVTDGSGNTATCTQTVTVTENVLPVISCTGNKVVSSDPGVCTFTKVGNSWDATATDNCTVSSVTYVLSGVTTGSGTTLAGVIFNKGVTTVTWTVVDGSGNTATCSQTVTVNDTEAPVLVCPGTQTLNVGAGAGCTVPMPDFRGLVSVSDNCTATGSITLEQLSPNGPGTPVIGYGGTRTIVIRATDASGNVSTCSFTLNLVDQTPPVAICKSITVNLSPAGTASIIPSQVNNGSTDNCSVVTLRLPQYLQLC